LLHFPDEPAYTLHRAQYGTRAALPQRQFLDGFDCLSLEQLVLSLPHYNDSGNLLGTPLLPLSDEVK
jgi:hypothetical protein